MGLYLRPMSDLHLELGSPFLPPPMETDADTVLILAGDINNKSRALPWIQALAPRFKHVIYVLGNHDYWKDHLQMLPEKIQQEIAEAQLPNVSLLDCGELVIEGVRFLGGTLWTDFNRENPVSMLNAVSFMADYDQIRAAGWRRLRPSDILEEHKRCRGFLRGKLAEKFDGPTVVVTHHGPTWQSIHRRYARASGNEYYVSSLEDLILMGRPKYWIHGHTHESLDYVVGETRVLTNPFGYYGYEVNSEFNPELRLET